MPEATSSNCLFPTTPGYNFATPTSKAQLTSTAIESRQRENNAENSCNFCSQPLSQSRHCYFHYHHCAMKRVPERDDSCDDKRENDHGKGPPRPSHPSDEPYPSVLMAQLKESNPYHLDDCDPTNSAFVTGQDSKSRRQADEGQIKAYVSQDSIESAGPTRNGKLWKGTEDFKELFQEMLMQNKKDYAKAIRKVLLGFEEIEEYSKRIEAFSTQGVDVGAFADSRGSKEVGDSLSKRCRLPSMYYLLPGHMPGIDGLLARLRDKYVARKSETFVDHQWVKFVYAINVKHTDILELKEDWKSVMKESLVEAAYFCHHGVELLVLGDHELFVRKVLTEIGVIPLDCNTLIPFRHTNMELVKGKDLKEKFYSRTLKRWKWVRDKTDNPAARLWYDDKIQELYSAYL